MLATLLRLQHNKSAVNDEVVLTLVVLCQEMGSTFGRYLNDVMPVLMVGLARHQDLSVCRICINAIGDIAREVPGGLENYADGCVRCVWRRRAGSSHARVWAFSRRLLILRKFSTCSEHRHIPCTAGSFEAK